MQLDFFEALSEGPELPKVRFAHPRLRIIGRFHRPCRIIRYGGFVIQRDWSDRTITLLMSC